MVSEDRVIMLVKELRRVQMIRHMMDKKLTPRHIRRLIDRVEQEEDHADHAPGSAARRSRAKGSAREDRDGHTEAESSVAPMPAV